MSKKAKLMMTVLGIVCVLSLVANAFFLSKGLGPSEEELTAQVAKMNSQVDSIKHIADSLDISVVKPLNGKIDTLRLTLDAYDEVLKQNITIKDAISNNLKKKGLN